ESTRRRIILEVDAATRVTQTSVTSEQRLQKQPHGGTRGHEDPLGHKLLPGVDVETVTLEPHVHPVGQRDSAASVPIYQSVTIGAVERHFPEPGGTHGLPQQLYECGIAAGEGGAVTGRAALAFGNHQSEQRRLPVWNRGFAEDRNASSDRDAIARTEFL